MPESTWRERVRQRVDRARGGFEPTVVAVSTIFVRRAAVIDNPSLATTVHNHLLPRVMDVYPPRWRIDDARHGLATIVAAVASRPRPDYPWIYPVEFETAERIEHDELAIRATRRRVRVERTRDAVSAVEQVESEGAE